MADPDLDPRLAGAQPSRSEPAEGVLDRLVHVLLGECLGSRLNALILLPRQEVVHVLGLLAAVRACHDGVVRKRLPLVDPHLEEPLAVRALATEEPLVVRRNRDGRLEALGGLSEAGDAVRKSMLPAHTAIQATSPDSSLCAASADSTQITRDINLPNKPESRRLVLR